jgi:hypothetical protein
MEKALDQKPSGRPEKNQVPEEKLREEVKRLRDELANRETILKKAEKEKKTLEGELWMTRHVINYWTKYGLVELKKNGLLARILKRIFSRVGKKPLKTEGDLKSSSGSSDSVEVDTIDGASDNVQEKTSKTENRS